MRSLASRELEHKFSYIKTGKRGRAWYVPQTCKQNTSRKIQMILQLDLVLDEAWNRTFSLENKYELKDFEPNELGFTR